MRRSKVRIKGRAGAQKGKSVGARSLIRTSVPKGRAKVGTMTCKVQFHLQEQGQGQV